jgi:carboxypeptidase C (cathepsin A)
MLVLMTAANVVFVESPVAVGFSYSSNKSDYESFGDTQTGDHYIHFCIMALCFYHSVHP